MKLQAPKGTRDFYPADMAWRNHLTDAWRRVSIRNGPLTLVDGELSDEDLSFASRIAARFSQGRDAENVTVKVTRKNGEEKTIDIKPMPVSEIQQEWYI